MSFHVNAEELRVDDGHILRGNLPNEDGDLVEAEIDLNTALGNNDGTPRPASSIQYSKKADIYLCLKLE